MGEHKKGLRSVPSEKSVESFFVFRTVFIVSRHTYKKLHNILFSLKLQYLKVVFLIFILFVSGQCSTAWKQTIPI
jgi:hypothetical protein